MLVPSARRPVSWLLCSLLVAACADDSSPTASGEASSGTTAATSSEGGTSSGPAGSDTTTAAQTSTTQGPDGTSSTGSTSSDDGSSSESGASSSSDGSSSSSGTTTGEQGNVVYTAVAIPGGLDRIRIHKANLDTDTCTWMVLVAPSAVSAYPAVATPEGWSLEEVGINDVAATCSVNNPAMFGAEAAIDAEGTVEFGELGGSGLYPCSLDVDTSLEFQGLLQVPQMDTMVATDLAVTDC